MKNLRSMKWRLNSRKSYNNQKKILMKLNRVNFSLFSWRKTAQKFRNLFNLSQMSTLGGE